VLKRFAIVGLLLVMTGSSAPAPVANATTDFASEALAGRLVTAFRRTDGHQHESTDVRIARGISPLRLAYEKGAWRWPFVSGFNAKRKPEKTLFRLSTRAGKPAVWTDFPFQKDWRKSKDPEVRRYGARLNELAVFLAVHLPLIPEYELVSKTSYLRMSSTLLSDYDEDRRFLFFSFIAHQPRIDFGHLKKWWAKIDEKNVFEKDRRAARLALYTNAVAQLREDYQRLAAANGAMAILDLNTAERLERRRTHFLVEFGLTRREEDALAKWEKELREEKYLAMKAERPFRLIISPSDLLLASKPFPKKRWEQRHRRYDESLLDTVIFAYLRDYAEALEYDPDWIDHQQWPAHEAVFEAIRRRLRGDLKSIAIIGAAGGAAALARVWFGDPSASSSLVPNAVSLGATFIPVSRRVALKLLWGGAAAIQAQEPISRQAQTIEAYLKQKRSVQEMMKGIPVEWGPWRSFRTVDDVYRNRPPKGTAARIFRHAREPILTVLFPTYAEGGLAFDRLRYSDPKERILEDSAVEEHLLKQGLAGGIVFRMATLAAFFNKAEAEAFALNPYELAVRQLALDSGFMTRSSEGTYVGREDAVLANIIVQGDPWFARLMIDHEINHAVAMTDPAYDVQLKRLYDGLDADSIEFVDAVMTWMAQRLRVFEENAAYLLELGQSLPSSVAPYFDGSRLTKEARNIFFMLQRQVVQLDRYSRFYRDGQPAPSQGLRGAGATALLAAS
jgi:hypothetical protein